MATKTPSPSRTKTTKPVSGASTGVVGVDGKAKGTVELPKSLFAAKKNTMLLAQAVRVWRTNQREGAAHTKTRGEVSGSTRKIYRQKGTGRARHGAIRAPIFVGGGIVFGPRSRTIRLTMPQKMRRAALAAALTEQHKRGNVRVVSGFATLEPKTKVMAQAMDAVAAQAPVLLVVSKDAQNVKLGMRNLPTVDITDARLLHVYDVLAHRTVVFMKEAVSEL